MLTPVYHGLQAVGAAGNELWERHAETRSKACVIEAEPSPAGMAAPARSFAAPRALLSLHPHQATALGAGAFLTQDFGALTARQWPCSQVEVALGEHCEELCAIECKQWLCEMYTGR